MSDALTQQAASLYQAGRLHEAGQLYEQILRANPRHFEALYSLGMIHLKLGQFEEAQNFLAEAMKRNPRFAEGWCARGLVLLQLRRREEALACFDRSLALKPDFLESLSSRATALLEMNRLEEALAGFDRVVAMRPDHAISWNNRGNTFVAMRRHEEALASFDRALALQPDLEIAQNNRNLAILELRRSTRIPAVAVRTLFDGYASYYDTALVDGLDYRAPAHLRTLLRAYGPARRRRCVFWIWAAARGLAGQAFKDLAMSGRLDGIDLSPLMIEKARARGLYDDLIVGDFETVLTAAGRAYDLVIAADSLIYHGDLGPALSGVARRLEPGGLCLFTVERMDGDAWEQTPANRFRHSESYVRQAAARAGLFVAEIMECTLRSESKEPVQGFAVALRKAA